MNLEELQANSDSWSWEIKNHKTLHLYYHFADLQVSCKYGAYIKRLFKWQ